VILLILAPLATVAVYESREMLRLHRRLGPTFPSGGDPLPGSTVHATNDHREGFPENFHLPPLPEATRESFPIPLSLNSQPIHPQDRSRLERGQSRTVVPEPTLPPPLLLPNGLNSDAVPGLERLAVPPSIPTLDAPTRQGDKPPAAVPSRIGSEPISAVKLESGNEVGKRSRPSLAIGFAVPGTNGNFPTAAELEPVAGSPKGAAESEHDDVGLANSPAGDSTASAGRDIPSKDQLLEDLAAEAAERRVQLDELSRRKRLARETLAAEAGIQIANDRVRFRQDLRQLLARDGKNAGPAIDELCERYGRARDPVLRARVKQLLAWTSGRGRTTREEKVQLLRNHGVPEPAVLDFLANDLHRRLNARNGPRSTDEVLVAAAKLLLSIKTPPPPKSGGPAPAPIAPRVERSR